MQQCGPKENTLTQRPEGFSTVMHLICALDTGSPVLVNITQMSAQNLLN